MSTYTENYSLIKPDETDLYDVQDFNENMDAIDAQMALAESAMESISEKIGEPTDTGSDTLFGKLSSGGSLVKSIQTVDLSSGFDGKTHDLKIQTVDPAKCVVLPFYLMNSSGGGVSCSYALNADKLVVSLGSNASYWVWVQFQIIEFY